ncbi:MAG: small subunit ribosomal protein S2 [Microgenomates group bacterium Gr01-1014_16]|nr:MAG: small subunit ribosomal protein S2 [Microgenomates group bacterium Gr01-1014_16]
MSEVTLKDLLEAGAHFGHQGRRWNPKMAKYIFGERGGVHIIDLVQTKKGLDEACEFVKKLASEGKVVLFVGTKRQAAGIVKDQAVKAGMPYLTQRWVGGLLTNWQEISKRIRKLHEMKEKREKGEYKVYTKREQAMRMKIPVVGLVDTNADPTQVDYVIPGNDDAVKAVELVVKAVTEAIEEGNKEKKPKES